MKAAQAPLNRRMKLQTTDTCIHMDEAQKYYAAWKETLYKWVLRYYFHKLLEQANLTHDESRTAGDREGAAETGTDWEGDESLTW